jgi:hypothetical protein
LINKVNCKINKNLVQKVFHENTIRNQDKETGKENREERVR